MDTIIQATPLARGRMAVLVVGAGGNGARLVPPLTQMLRRGDYLGILDHDIVEDRNLGRQHFAPRDIGQPKAAVLWNRYRREGLLGDAMVNQITAENAHAVIDEFMQQAHIETHTMTVLLGCVDNNRSRGIMRAAATRLGDNGIDNVAWIDVGNSTREGQVLMTLPRWQLRVRQNAVMTDGHFSLPAMAVAFPQLLRPTAEEAAEVSCADRVDLQTVMVNHLAAATAINCLSWLLLGIPFSAAGAFFSTLNTMQPIKIERVDFGNHTLIPEKTFAVAADGAGV